jgi:hypothetical protein
VAKKSKESRAPKVTSLPLPISDTPLVIDLPDGQKIVVGKMQPGSVIEVATWRGTGRPDSRTNRLMMGMNNGESSNPATADTEKKNESKNVIQTGDWKAKALFLGKNFISQAQRSISQLSLQIKKRKPGVAKIQPASRASASDLASATEVDEWLQKVLERSEKQSARAIRKSASMPKKAAKTVKKSAQKKSNR